MNSAGCSCWVGRRSLDLSLAIVHAAAAALVVPDLLLVADLGGVVDEESL